MLIMVEQNGNIRYNNGDNNYNCSNVDDNKNNNNNQHNNAIVIDNNNTNSN